MCGIVGYTGAREAGPILVAALRHLEYRGYDSAGVAVVAGDGPARVVKRDGKVQVLAQELDLAMPRGTTGIGHTRWATHGSPTARNAHPHSDCRGRILAVHNGIIENFAELRAELATAGHTFTSETDSEVLPHLVESLLRPGMAPTEDEFVEAAREAFRRLSGAFAVVVCATGLPGLLVGARLNAPLLVGLGEGEWFLASDPTAVLSHTRRTLPLDDGEMVVVGGGGPRVSRIADRQAVEHEQVLVDWDLSQAEKRGFPHFMLKEIHEVPETVRNTMRGRLGLPGPGAGAGGGQVLPDLALAAAQSTGLRSVRLLGMGTSRHAAMVGEYLIESWAGLHARAEDASEFRYRHSPPEEGGLAVVLTQSGETADTLAGMRKARAAGAHTLAVTNVVGSTAAREADSVLYLHAGPEIGVASTKTFVAHVVSEVLLALRLAGDRGVLEAGRLATVRDSLGRLPARIQDVLDMDPRITELADSYSSYRDFMFVGRGLGLPVALEGALKLKEISYLHAEGTTAGDLKHGPIALLDAEFPVIAVCTEPGEMAARMATSVHEVAARGAPVLALVSAGDRSLDGVASDLLELPAADEVSMAILASVALQLFAYRVAARLGEDIDQPRNLAKSVTVE